LTGILPFSLMVTQIKAHNLESFSCCVQCRTGSFRNGVPQNICTGVIGGRLSNNRGDGALCGTRGIEKADEDQGLFMLLFVTFQVVCNSTMNNFIAGFKIVFVSVSRFSHIKLLSHIKVIDRRSSLYS